MKHIPIKYHFFREQVIEKNIKLEYVGTKEQIANIFTKPLPSEAFEYLCQKLGFLPSFHYNHSLIYSSRKGEWRRVQVHWMTVCQGELPFSIDEKVGEKAIGRGVMITERVRVLPSIPKGEIVDKWLSLMSTQEELGATPILHGHFDLKNLSILIQISSLWILLVDMFLLIYGMPPSSSWFEIYLHLKLVTPVSGLKPYGVVAWHS